MAYDEELERLKVAKNQAFAKQQELFQKLQTAWEKLLSVKERKNVASEARQSAYEARQLSFIDYKSVMDLNCPKIDLLKSKQENAHRKMIDTFNQASAYYFKGDDVSAKLYSKKGHSYKEEERKIAEEKGRLIEECRAAKERHKPYVDAFEAAKKVFDDVKNEYLSANLEHGRINEEFAQARAIFGSATEALEQGFDELRAEAEIRIQRNRIIAEKAGVPSRYLNKVIVSKGADGCTNILFGGKGKPDGEGHGHFVLDPSGKISYERKPGEEKGSHNFID